MVISRVGGRANDALESEARQRHATTAKDLTIGISQLSETNLPSTSKRGSRN
jgi:hypothetical protein